MDTTIESLAEKVQTLQDAPVAIYASRELYRRALLACEDRPVNGSEAPSLLGVEFREDPVLTEKASRFAGVIVMFGSRDAQAEWHEASLKEKERMLFNTGPLIMDPLGRPGWDEQTLSPRPDGMRVLFVTESENDDG